MKNPFRRDDTGVARVTVAIGVSSAAGLALQALVGRMLTPAEFALFLSFWGMLFAIGGSLSILEQETARQTAAHEDDSGSSMYGVTVSAAVLAGLVAAATMIPPIAERFYGRSNWAMGLVVVFAAVGFAIQFALRGTLIGSGAIRPYSAIVILEAVARLVLLLIFAVSFGVNLPTAAIAVGIGSFAWLVWFRRAHGTVPRERLSSRQWRTALRTAASLMVAAGLMAVMIVGYPAMVSSLTDEPPSAARGAVLAALTLSRFPLILVSPIQALAVPTIVRWRSNATAASARKARLLVTGGTLAATAVGLVGGVAGWLWGPAVVRLVYGSDYDASPRAAALLVLSAFLLAWVLLMSAALIALAAHRRMVVMWLAAVVASAVWLLVSPLGIMDTTAVGALVAPVVALACAIPKLWSLMRPGPLPDPTT